MIPFIGFFVVRRARAEEGAAPSQAPGPVVVTPEPSRAPAEAPRQGAPLVELPDGLRERELAILRAVETGAYDHGGWWSVTSEANGHKAIIPVFRRALGLVTEGGRLAVSVSFTLAQRIADVISARDIPVNLLTSRVADLIYQQASTRLPVMNQPVWVRDGSMGSTRRLVEYSALIERAAGASEGLVANEGKHWVITRRNWPPPQGTGKEAPEGKTGSRHNGANFGWHGPSAPSKSPGGERVFQSIGLAHDRHHADYSQLLVLMGSRILVDEQLRDAAEVVRDTELAPLLSDEGPLPSLRHPDV